KSLRRRSRRSGGGVDLDFSDSQQRACSFHHRFGRQPKTGAPSRNRKPWRSLACCQSSLYTAWLEATGLQTHSPPPQRLAPGRLGGHRCPVNQSLVPSGRCLAVDLGVTAEGNAATAACVGSTREASELASCKSRLLLRGRARGRGSHRW